MLEFIYRFRHSFFSQHSNSFAYTITRKHSYPTRITRYKHSKYPSNYYIRLKRLPYHQSKTTKWISGNLYFQSLLSLMFPIISNDFHQPSFNDVPDIPFLPTSLEQMYDFNLESIKTTVFHNEHIWFQSQYEISLNSFVSTIDPLNAIHTLKALHSKHFLSCTSPIQTIGSEGLFIAMLSELEPSRSVIDPDLDFSTQIYSPADYHKAHFQSCQAYQQNMFHSPTPDLPIVIDTGASTSITPVLSDFVGDLSPASTAEVNQLSGSTKVVGKGLVEWEIQDLWGVSYVIQTEAYYIPQATIRLFSPQAYFQRHQGGHCIVHDKKIQLKLKDHTILEFPYNKGGNLPLMLMSTQRDSVTPNLRSPETTLLTQPSLLHSYLSVVHQTNQNLTSSQKELLLLHQKLGHVNFGWIQRLCAKPRDTSLKPVLLTKNNYVSTVSTPICAACQMGKQSKKKPATDRVGKSKPMILKRSDLQPGDTVSMDQYVAGKTLGRLPHTKGKESRNQKYVGGTIFTDHSSQFVFIRHQASLNSGETIRAKHAFEQEVQSFGVKIKQYLTDNTPFSSEEFMKDIQVQKQNIKFSGVGAHHQNGVAERTIQIITQLARAMMCHATIMWPDQANLELWPFAMDHAVYVYNNLPKPDHKRSPIELLSKSFQSDYNHLHRLHVFGCPCYVLDPKLQDGHKIPKWNPRARRGQYLGISPSHSTLVGRILNIKTGNLSPQYHVVYDDLFTSVPNSENGGFQKDSEPFTETEWKNLIQTGHERILPEPNPSQNEKLPSLHDSWLTDREILRRNFNRTQNKARQSPPRVHFDDSEPVLISPPDGASSPTSSSEGGENIVSTQHHSDDLSLQEEQEIPADFNLDQDVPIEEQEQRIPQDISIPEPTRTRSGREVKRPIRLIETIAIASDYDPTRKIKMDKLNNQFIQSLHWKKLTDSILSNDLQAFLSQVNYSTNVDDQTIEELHPLALATQANAADNPSWEQAVNGPDSAGYWKAMEKEIGTLQDDMNSWDVVDRQSWMNILPSTWAFRCKRFPNGEVRKLKARFCARGDRQISGVDFYDTFAPVTNWTTVRIMLIMSLILQLSTKQVDYTAAFVHAPIDRPPNYDQMSKEDKAKSGVYVEMPRGFSKAGKVLKLRKSLYGLKQAPRNFFQHLKKQLESIGFKSNPDIDPCLFVTDKVICIVYVDDTLFFSPKEEYIEEVITGLKSCELELEVENSVAGFLGVHIDRREDGTIKLTQEGLVKRIIEVLKINDKPRKFTPAAAEPLSKDLEGDPPNGIYSYPSIIGMMQYLQGHSRPDITYAVSQCARFTHSPRRSHEIALERIGQYLKGTVHEGLILKPSKNYTVDVYVDSDFAGLWPYEERNDPSCVKSRAGFVISVSSCPVIWNTKLMQDIALSTMEAEYNALSLCMRSVLPFIRTFKKILSGLGIERSETIDFKTTVWEDNVGALTLANLESGQMTPRSKHYAVKYHWFRSKLKPNDIIIQKIDTKDQKADILTKGLRKDLFERIRKLLCGW